MFTQTLNKRFLNKNVFLINKKEFIPLIKRFLKCFLNIFLQ